MPTITEAPGPRLDELIEALADPVTVLGGSILTLSRRWDDLDPAEKRALVQAADGKVRSIKELTAGEVGREKGSLCHMLRKALVSVSMPVEITISEWDRITDGKKREWIDWAAREVRRVRDVFDQASNERPGYVT